MRDEWCLVKHEDELRPGMCVELRPCLTGETARFILLEIASVGCPDDHRESSWHTTDYAGDLDGFCPRHGAISERRLYRLIDDDTAADETATTKLKERVPSTYSEDRP